MPSLRARLVLWTFRNRHLLRFKPIKKAVDWTRVESIQKFRHDCEKGAVRFGRLQVGIQAVAEQIADMTCEWIIPAGAASDRVILFVHGGGYVSGSCSDHRVHVSKFVRGTGIRALLYPYRLAPEHPYPAALEDSLSAYRWLLDQGYHGHNIILAGDSAGGGLCLALLLALRDADIPLPGAAVALSPWTDLACSGSSYRTNAEKCLSPTGCWQAFSRHYCAETDPRTAWISPLYGDLHGLPPLYISVGSDEILRDDSLRFAEKARAAGVDVTLKVGEGLFHCYPVCSPLFPEAVIAMNEIAAFIKDRFQRQERC